MDSLDRCITGLHVKQAEADSARFGTIGAQTLADGVLWDQLFEIRFRALTLDRHGRFQDAAIKNDRRRFIHLGGSNNGLFLA
jgi:hypothetical protein